MKKIYLIIITTFLGFQLKAQIYVSQNGLGNKDGSSWGNAYEGTKLQDAINAAETATVKEVWVAKGTYKPTQNLTGTDNLDKSFVLKAGVKIYGGFAGNSADNLANRVFSANETILSGDFGGGVNAHHVVVNIANIAGAVLDGFTITGGNANGIDAAGGILRNNGGGIYLTSNIGISFKNIIITGNLASSYGGGIFLSYSGTAAYTFEAVSFMDNDATTRAGALYVNRTSGTPSVTIKDGKFIGNESATGGAIYFTANSLATIEKTIFNGNKASGSGGGIYNNQANVTLTVTDFEGCTAASGGALYTYHTGSVSAINKCKFYSNKTTGIGGAINAYSGVVNLYNSIFYNNEASTASVAFAGNPGGKGTLKAVNCTFYGNKNSSATLGAIVFQNTDIRADIKLYNNIFRNNTSNNGAEISDVNRAVIVVPQDYQNNLFETSIISEGSRTVSDNIDFSDPAHVGKPLFAPNTSNPANADFLNIVEGLATQKGNNTLATAAGLLPGLDLLGNNRETHDVIDLGAYEYQGVLPVQFDYFRAAKVGGAANLTWRTVAETNNNYFTVERGSSPTNFVELTRKTAAGTTTEATAYSFVDQNPLNGTNYYRLTQYDNNGDFKILGEQALTFSLNASQNLVYPNPATQQVSVKIAEVKGAVTVDLMSMTGQTLLRKAYNISVNEEITIDLADVPRGSYILWLNKGKNNSDKKKLLVVK